MYRSWIGWRVLVLAALLAGAGTGSAYAALYELSWGYKWGSGDIVFDGSVPDSNPDPNRGDHFGSIVSYDVMGWTDDPAPVRLMGNSGAILVQSAPACEEGAESCAGAALRFELGTASPPYAPSGWHLAMGIPWELGNFFDHLPTGPFDPEFDRYSFTGSIVPNTPNGQRFAPLIDPTGSVFLFALAAPIPETGTFALFGLGCAMLVWSRRGRGISARR